MKRVCVFCGSSSGAQPIYQKIAFSVGRLLTEHGYGVVYGGGRVGLMGALAEGTLAAGGNLVGIIPKVLFDKEIGNSDLKDLRIVGSMHERKALMAELSEAFITLPGGFGTFEECFEMVTWSQLGVHKKPCGVLNINGFYDPLLNMCDRAVSQGFLTEVDRKLIISDPDPESLIQRVLTFKVPESTKWLSIKQT
jgi:uncharacterized protein (TIGR00730 family)